MLVSSVMYILMAMPVSSSYGLDQDSGAPEASGRSCQCVAFRLDDIQDYFLSQAQIEIVRTFEERNASLTIGIIGNYFGDDPALLAFVKEKMKSTNFDMEVANHGWNHEDFTAFDKDEQSTLLSQSNDRIFEKLGVSPDVFIAPLNRINNDTILSLATNDIHLLSANVTASQMPFIRNVTLTDGSVVVISHFPATAKTGDLNADDTEWLGSTHEETLGEIKDGMEKYGYALVTMHPQEFSVRQGIKYQNEVETEQLHELSLLLDAIQSEGYTVVTVSELANRVTIPEFSSSTIALMATIIAVSAAMGRKIFRSDAASFAFNSNTLGS